MDFSDLDDLQQRLEAEEREAFEHERAERKRKAQEKKDARVVGGIYHRDPIDRAASMLVAKAPWYCHPPTKPKMEPPKGVSMEKTQAGMTHDQVRNKHSKYGTEGGIPASVVNEMNELVVGVKDKHKMKLIQALDSLGGVTKEEGLMVLRDCATEYTNATVELKKANLAFREEMRKLQEISKQAITETRSRRHALVKETADSLDALREMRMFFIESDYQIERDRLADFVEVCERLKALHDSGFIDVVSETMLKLAVDDR